MSIMEQKVDRLEALFGQFVIETQIKLNKLTEALNKFHEDTQKMIKEMRESDERLRKEMKELDESFREELREIVKEMRESDERLREEMRESDRKLKEMIEEMRRQWGALSNKLGTIVEDFFSPSIDIAIKKFFNVLPDVIDIRKLVRKDGKSLELDILALCREEKKAFVVEVKSSPDREEYMDKFVEKLKSIPDFLPELKDYKIYPIYAGINMNKETVEKATKKKLYAMIVKGDVLEIVNIDELKEVYEKNFDN